MLKCGKTATLFHSLSARIEQHKIDGLPTLFRDFVHILQKPYDNRLQPQKGPTFCIPVRSYTNGGACDGSDRSTAPPTTCRASGLLVGSTHGGQRPTYAGACHNLGIGSGDRGCGHGEEDVECGSWGFHGCSGV
ncbi:hypothetical protein B0H34DRAFT_384074 [Crassisporium funariophilum]|nr:hypothetical protein B0H34DRAFT_384074 [Crassisporium funariophilum]